MWRFPVLPVFNKYCFSGKITQGKNQAIMVMHALRKRNYLWLNLNSYKAMSDFYTLHGHNFFSAFDDSGSNDDDFEDEDEDDADDADDDFADEDMDELIFDADEEGIEDFGEIKDEDDIDDDFDDDDEESEEDIDDDDDDF
jgi:hypothetical protein